MKKTVIIFAAALMALTALFGCKKFKTQGDVSHYVAVSDVSLNYSSETIEIGGTLELYATVEPWDATYKTVTWTSSKENVATVSDQGVVTGVNTGTATITATTSNGHTATCQIEVVYEKIAVTGISIEPASDVIKIEGWTRLNVRFTPANATNHKVSWHSSNDGIASVDGTGLVTGHSKGTATITAKSDDGGHEATATVKVVKPFTSITITSPDQSDYHYKDGKFKYVVGETFQLQAEGEPSDSDDEIEYRVYGWGNNNYLNYFDISETGLVEAIKPYSNCNVSARSKADESVETVFTFDVLAAPENILLTTARQSDYEVNVMWTSPNYVRNTEYIGHGTTQKFKVVVEPSNAPQNVSISQGPSMSVVSASIDDGILSVTVPSSASVSTLSNTVKFTITLSAANGHTNTFTFKVCTKDPYKVKTGDLIDVYGRIYDGGYRGNGLFEESVYKNTSFNSIIAWLGDEHTREDPFWAAHKPTTGIKDEKGNVIHGIAIPVNTDRLYRSAATAGEYYYGDSNNDNYIIASGNLPNAWLNSEERKMLLLSNSTKHSAIFNTSVHVYTNKGRGESYEIRPANFFVDKFTTNPDNPGSQDFDGSKYLFYGSFIGSDARSSNTTFNAYSSHESSLRRYHMTTWLWPTIADIYSIFTGEDNPSSVLAFTSQTFTSLSTVNENRVNIFRHSAEMAGYKGENTPTYDCSWWIANESGRDATSGNPLRLTQASVSGATLTINTNVLHKSDSWKAYVLPIRYF